MAMLLTVVLHAKSKDIPQHHLMGLSGVVHSGTKQLIYAILKRTKRSVDKTDCTPPPPRNGGVQNQYQRPKSMCRQT